MPRNANAYQEASQPPSERHGWLFQSRDRVWCSRSEIMNDPFCVGTTLSGRFRLERVIGLGGISVVYEATHLGLGTSVALKLLRPQALQCPELVKRFAQEARIAIQLRHPNVVTVMDAGELSEGVPYMAMELLAGEDLGQCITRHGKLSVAQAVDYGMQLCAALAQAHARGILHRDLKPTNLFLTETEGRSQLKVIDFGISKQTIMQPGQYISLTKEIVGTPAYMSPEQMRSARDVDARTDVWSFGITMYEMLTGQLPFGNGAMPDVYARIITRPPPRLGLDESLNRLEDVILHCLVRDPNRRFQAINAVARALAPFANPELAERAVPIPEVLGVLAQDRTTEHLYPTRSDAPCELRTTDIASRSPQSSAAPTRSMPRCSPASALKALPVASADSKRRMRLIAIGFLFILTVVLGWATHRSRVLTQTSSPVRVPD